MPEGDRFTGVTETRVRHDAHFVNPPVVHVKKDVPEQITDELKMIAKTAFFTTVVHPFNYAQVLMQIGYEPLPPVPGKDMFGKPVLRLGSVFDYLDHIRKQTGWKGLFLGLGPTLAVTIGTVYVYRATQRVIKYVYDERYLGRPEHIDIKRFTFLESADSERNTMSNLRFVPKEVVGVTYTATNFVEDLTKEITIVSISMALTWPLQVIAFRSMAQFVGGEHIYDNLIDAAREILNTEGISGFFKGLFPMWYSYVSITSVMYVAVFSYASYNTINPYNLKLVSAAAGAIANSFFYPLKLTSRVFSVSGARLAAARPPRMPAFTRWRDLHNYLVATGDSKRGSSMLFRKIPFTKGVGVAPGDRVSTGAIYRTNSVRGGGDDWSQKFTSSQLMAMEGHRRSTGLRFVF